MSEQPGRWQAVVETPLPGGVRLGVICGEHGVAAIDFLPATVGLQAPDSAPARAAVAALATYFAGGGWRPPVVELAGTPFQRRVWAQLLLIGPGETRTYGELAMLLGTAARAVAGACRANPVPILVPCHRVVAVGGLGGYMGCMEGPELALKAWLLAHERAV